MPAACYSPACVICGPQPRCELPWVEGVIGSVERQQYTGPRGPFEGARLHLRTADGTPCILLLGARFAAIVDGLQQAPEGMVIRAYHLRRGRAGAAGSGVPRYLTDPDSLVVLEPDWLIDVTALKGTDYCLRQWLANRLAAQPPTVHQLRGTVVHRCFELLCREGSIPDDAARGAIARETLDLAMLGAAPADLAEAVAPHLERLRQWYGLFGADLFADPRSTPCFEGTLLCPELGLRGRVDLAFRSDGPDGRQLVDRVIELKTGRYNEEWPDPEFQVRGYYAILSSQDRLAADFSAQVIYTGGAAVAYRRVQCGPEHVQAVVEGRNRAVLALLIGHAPPPQSLNKCRKSSSRLDCVRLSGLLGLDHCRGRDLADAAAGDGDPLDARFYADQYRLLRLEAHATIRALAALWRGSPAQRVAEGTAVEVLETLDCWEDAGGRRYRLRCENRSELRVGDTVLLSDGDPVRGEVTVGTLLAAVTGEVEVATREPVACPLLIDRYDNGEAQDRTLRALHAWLQAPERLRGLLYAERPPELALPGRGTFTTETRRHRDCTEREGETRVVEACSVAHGGVGEGLNQRQAQALGLALRARDYLLVQGPPGTGKTFLIAHIVRALVGRGERVVLSAWTNQAVDTMLHALIAQGFGDVVRLGSPRAVDPALARYLAVPIDAGEDGDAPGAPDPERVARALRETPVIAGTVSALAHPRFAAPALRRDVLILDEAAQLGVAASVGALRLAQRFILVGDDQQLPPVVQSEEAAREGLSLSPFALLRPEAQAAGAFVLLSEQFRMHAAIAAWPSDAFYAGALVAHPAVAARTLPLAADGLTISTHPTVNGHSNGYAPRGRDGDEDATAVAPSLPSDRSRRPEPGQHVRGKDLTVNGHGTDGTINGRPSAGGRHLLDLSGREGDMDECGRAAGAATAVGSSAPSVSHEEIFGGQAGGVYGGGAGGVLVSPAAPVVLVDAGASAGRETLLAARAVAALLRCGLPAADIGVVAPFRGSVAAVRRLLEDGPGASCTVDTVDRFQGGQREAMVVCLGMDGIGRRGHAFVDDPRRLNVAFTRARAKLIVVGDLGRAAALPTLAGFLHHCRDHGVPVVQAAGWNGR